MKILILEDDNSICSLLRYIICDESKGRHCDSAATIDEAEALLLKNKYDMVLADLLIGGEQCIRFLESVRTYQPKAKLCMMSAWTGAERIADVNKVDCFLSKPFSLESIEEIICTFP